MEKQTGRKRLLIIEDEFRLADMLKDYFTAEGMEVQVCTDGALGCRTAVTERFDTIILDVMLPGMDGFEILRTLRQKRVQTPVLMLTARGELSDKLNGLTNGADDYLTKPFSVAELRARVQLLMEKSVLLRRVKEERDAQKVEEIPSKEQEGTCYLDLLLDSQRRYLCSRTSGREIRLPAKEYSLMEYLLQYPGQILSKEQITVRIWGYESDASYNNEEVYISFLRKKLKYLDSEAEIATVRGAGYRLGKKS